MTPTWRFVSRCVGVHYGRIFAGSILLTVALMGQPANGDAQGFMPAGSGQVDLPDDTAPSNGEVRLHASEPRQSEPAREASAPARDAGPSAEQKRAAAEARRAAARQRAEVQKLENTVADLQHKVDDWHAQAVKQLEDGGGAATPGGAVARSTPPDGDGSGDPRLKVYDENLPALPTTDVSPDASGDPASRGAARRMMDRLFPASPKPDAPAPDAPTPRNGDANGAAEEIRRYQDRSEIAPGNFIQNNREGMDAVTRGFNAVTGGDGMIHEGDSPMP